MLQQRQPTTVLQIQQKKQPKNNAIHGLQQSKTKMRIIVRTPKRRRRIPFIFPLLSLLLLFAVEQCQQQRRCQQQQPPLPSSSWFVEATVVGATTSTTTTLDSKEEHPQQQQNNRPRRTRRQPRRDVLNSPNFIVFFMDDLGYGDMGFTGHPTTHTPNLDWLAFHGKILTTWYSGCAACTGSRAALMTGRQWTRTGLPWVLGPITNQGLPLNETTIAEQLKKKKRNTKNTKKKAHNDDQHDTADKDGAGEGGDSDDGEGEYATAIVGKWHLGQRPIYLPGNRGFDYYLGIPYSDDMGDAITTTCSANNSDAASKSEWTNPYSDTTSSSAYLDETFDGRKDDVDPAAFHLPLVYQEYNTTHVLEQPLDFTTLSKKYKAFTTNFITMHQDQPFFLYVPFSHVHVTSKSQEELQYSGCTFHNYTTRGKFGDALAEADDMVGSILQTLKNLELLNNTLILFTSDNGPWLSRGLSAGSEGLFTGRYSGYYDTGKATTWEGGIRMPAFAYWLGQIEPHSRSSEIISSLDVFPTLSRLAGIPLPQHDDSSNQATIVYDGKDMTDILLSRSSNDSGGKSKHDFLFFYGTCHINVPYYTVTAVRHGPYKVSRDDAWLVSSCDLSARLTNPAVLSLVSVLRFIGSLVYRTRLVRWRQCHAN